MALLTIDDPIIVIGVPSNLYHNALKLIGASEAHLDVKLCRKWRLPPAKEIQGGVGMVQPFGRGTP